MQEWLDTPNFLSGFRLIAAPFLLSFAWMGHPNLFLSLLAISLFTDSIDGFVARKLNASSGFGAKLDSWAAKTSAVLISAASFLLFITDIAWPFKVAAIV